MRFSTVPPAVLMRAAVVAAAALIVLVDVVGWPAVLLGLAVVVWFADVWHRPRTSDRPR
ncbi:hypothetical protein JIG36_03210 [Actinoplanes sp. LDG1-06]|uniref:Uncharacterized protein n=1 Tax=Paractinoplanes ovalisporus TaxID=2810368 RepID=A0ABS2A3Y3_9ACTN|nr:hypothetical protein [Actinoplanes ovalisporus]MBM2614562.1 hypothetical protein [Actinoplanes ovalisporus]